MSFRDLIEMKDLAYIYVQRAGSNLVDKFFKRRPHEILRAAVVGRQADRGRDHVHRAEVVDRPFVSNDTGHADDASLLCALKRIRQRRCADQFKNLVDAARTDLPHLACDSPGIDEHLIYAAFSKE